MPAVTVHGPFLYSPSVYSCRLFLISSASVRSIPFLSFTVPIFAWSVPLVSPVFLKRSLVFPILLFSSISLHCSLKKAFLSLLAILWNSAFSWVYLSVSPWLSFLFFSQLFVRPPQTTTIVFLDFFLLGIVLVTVSYIMLWTSIYSSSGPLFTRSIPLKLFITSTV